LSCHGILRNRYINTADILPVRYRQVLPEIASSIFTIKESDIRESGLFLKVSPALNYECCRGGKEYGIRL